MGTSASSGGAPSGVSFDPPWLDDVVGGLVTAPGSSPSAPNDPEEATDDSESTAGEDIAPPERYKDARRELTKYIKSGSRSNLQASLSSFVEKGLGGAKRAAKRMRASAAAASALATAFQQIRENATQEIADWVAGAKARGLSANEIALEVIERILPNGGSIDEESIKNSMEQGVAKLYEDQPDVDLFAMSDENIYDLMGNVIGFDVYQRVQLELGQMFEHLQYSAQVVHERLNEMRDYVMAVVKAEMDLLKGTASQRAFSSVAAEALRSTLNVFGSV